MTSKLDHYTSNWPQSMPVMMEGKSRNTILQNLETKIAWKLSKVVLQIHWSHLPLQQHGSRASFACTCDRAVAKPRMSINIWVIKIGHKLGKNHKMLININEAFVPKFCKWIARDKDSLGEEVTGACFKLKFPQRFDFLKVCGTLSSASSHVLCFFMGFPSWPRQSEAPQWQCWSVPNWINLQYSKFRSRIQD